MGTKKSWVKGFIAGFIAAAILSTGLAYANEGLSAITAFINRGLRITYNGAAFKPQEADGSEIPVLSYNSRTYLPVRAVAEKSGVYVDYNEKTSEVILKSENELLNRANLVLHNLKYKDYKQLSTLVYKNGVTISPHPYFEADAIKFSPAQIAALKPTDIFNWGANMWAESDDDNGIVCTVDEYFTRYEEYMTAPYIGINNYINRGLDTNLFEVFPVASFVEYYIPPSNPDISHADWSSLRLIFIKTVDNFMLTGILQDFFTT